MCSLCKILLKIQIHVRSLKSESIFRASRKVSMEYSYFEKGCRKNCAEIPKGNVGYDQYVTVEPTFVAFL